MVKLSDPLLADVVLVKGEEGKVTSMPWENVYSRVISKMSNGYSITFKGGQPTVHKGKLELIEMNVGSRSGNKKVRIYLVAFNVWRPSILMTLNPTFFFLKIWVEKSPHWPLFHRSLLNSVDCNKTLFDPSKHLYNKMGQTLLKHGHRRYLIL